MPDPKRAAFFDVDGTLVRTNIVHAFGFYAMNQGTIFSTAWRTARTVAAVPLFWALDKTNRKVFNEVFYRSYQGMSEDRLVVLAGDLFEEVLRPAVHPGTPRLVEQARRAGCRIVFVSGALDFMMRLLADHLGANDVIANRLEFKDGFATGRSCRRRGRAREGAPRARARAREGPRSTSASPTRTATPTCRCSPSSATPPR